MSSSADPGTRVLRKAFVMQLHPGQVEEYRRRHDPIWPELQEVLRAHGVRSYSIFFHPETLQLFAYAEIESEERWAAIARTPVCARWWAYMRDLMDTNADNSPVSIALDEVFSQPPSSSPVAPLQMPVDRSSESE